MLISIKVVPEHFSLALIVFQKYYIYYDFQKLCDLENIGQDHDAQHSQWRHLMANT